MKQSQTIPEELNQWISSALKTYNLTIDDSKKISESILKLSEFYILNPEEATPWKEPWAQIATIAYYTPLNFLRAQSAIFELKKAIPLEQIQHVVDFGAGLAPEAWALQMQGYKNDFLFIEQSPVPERIYKTTPIKLKGQWHTHFQKPESKNTLGVFSYSLTELPTLPVWAQELDHLLLIEPSTQLDGRKLMELRQTFIDRGWRILAPCLHQQACPLLTQSLQDWCHFKIQTQMPDWFQKIEAFLPMKNQILSFSYLVMSKVSKPQDQLNENSALIVGDHLNEKGKNRQLICRGPDREYVSWMHRDFPNLKRPDWSEVPQRGDLIDLTGAQKVANELRFTPAEKQKKSD